MFRSFENSELEFASDFGFRNSNLIIGLPEEIMISSIQQATSMQRSIQKRGAAGISGRAAMKKERPSGETPLKAGILFVYA